MREAPKVWSVRSSQVGLRTGRVENDERAETMGNSSEWDGGQNLLLLSNTTNDDTTTTSRVIQYES